jgi:hypothetical protein
MQRNAKAGAPICSPARKRHAARFDYIAVPRRADPLRLHHRVYTPAGLALTAVGHLAHGQGQDYRETRSFRRSRRMRSRSSHRSSSLINSWRYFSSCLARRLCSADGCAGVALEFVRVMGSQSLEKSGSGWPSLRARVCFPALSVPAPVYARLATSPLRAAKDRIRRPSLYEHDPRAIAIARQTC